VASTHHLLIYGSRKKHAFRDTSIQEAQNTGSPAVLSVPVLYHFSTVLMPVTSYLGQLNLAIPLRVGAVNLYRSTCDLTPLIRYPTYSRLKV